MRNLFSGCAYVHTCIHTCRSRLGMSICGCTEIRNVNLRLRPECQFEAMLRISIWGHAQNVNLRSCLECQFEATLGMSIWGPAGVTDMLITRGCRDNISWRWRTGRKAWLGLHNICIWRSKCRNECWNVANAGWQLWDKKAKKSVHHRNQENEKDFKSRKHVLQTLHMPPSTLPPFTPQVLT